MNSEHIYIDKQPLVFPLHWRCAMFLRDVRSQAVNAARIDAIAMRIDSSALAPAVAGRALAHRGSPADARRARRTLKHAIEYLSWDLMSDGDDTCADIDSILILMKCNRLLYLESLDRPNLIERIHHSIDSSIAWVSGASERPE